MFENRGHLIGAFYLWLNLFIGEELLERDILLLRSKLLSHTAKNLHTSIITVCLSNLVCAAAYCYLCKVYLNYFIQASLGFNPLSSTIARLTWQVLLLDAEPYCLC